MLKTVQEIGAAAGLAGVVGLVVLSALYVSQARDVKRLREWAGRAPEASGRGGTAMPGRAAGVPPPARPQTAATASGAPAALTGSRPATGIGARSVTAALVGLLVLGGAAAYGVTQLTGGDGRDDSGNRSPHRPKRNGAAIDPGDVIVAVLNGTTVPGLAARLRDEIATAGFEKGAIDVFSDQQLGESVVQYAPGRQAEAKAVSRRLGIRRLEPATTHSRALAGDATVIVIAGADKAP